MNKQLIHNANRILAKLPGISSIMTNSNKRFLENYFWKTELNNIINWYTGIIPELYGCQTPTENQKFKHYTLLYSAVATWWKCFQEPKYCADLDIKENRFQSMRILDIGSGPFPSATVFNPAELFCIDPLIGTYIKSGYPTHIYSNVKFVNSPSENIPFENGYFDAIISVNALDHVDNFSRVAEEINRVLKPNGLLALHLHFHEKTLTEPLELSDELVRKAFNNINNFTLVKKSKQKYGWVIKEPNEYYCLYKNFND